MKTRTYNNTLLSRIILVMIAFALLLSTVIISLSARQAHAAPTIEVTTFAGTASTVGYVDGPASSAQFNYPHDIAFDAAGTMYVVDTSNNRIRAISPSGVVSTFAGSGVAGGADGVGTAAEFSSPHSIAINPTTGIMYVTEASLEPSNHTPRVRAITPTGVVTTLAGSGVPGLADGTGTAAQFFFPTGIAVNANTGMIYVADSYAHSIRAITPAGVVTTIAGFDDILDVAAAPNGGYADGTGTAARFSYPQGIDVGGDGMIYVAEFGGHRIRTVTPTGVVTTIAGNGVAGYADGTGTAAQFNSPTGVVVDPSGTIYIADSFNNRIRAITPAGVVTTIAGTGTAGSVNGAGEVAQFNAPTGIVLNSAGDLFITDTYNQLIRQITINTPTPTGDSDSGGAAIPGAPNAGSGAQLNTLAVLAITGVLLALITLVMSRKRSMYRGK